MSAPTFELTGSRTPIGRLKEFAHFEDGRTCDPAYHGGEVFCAKGYRRWVYFPNPYKYFTLPLEDIIAMFERTILGADVDYQGIDDEYDEHCGAYCNIFDMDPRFFGILGTIRSLLAIPVSGEGVPSVVLLRGLFKPGGVDSYSMDFRTEPHDVWSYTGFDPVVFEDAWYWGKRFEDPCELVRIFNALAHARGLLTGIVIMTNEDQVHFANRDGHHHTMRWEDEADQRVYLERVNHALSLGFDVVYVDSAKHIGGNDEDGCYREVWDSDNYWGAGKPIQQFHMEMLRDNLWTHRGRRPILVGDQAYEHYRYHDMGFQAGVHHDACHAHDGYIAEVGRDQSHNPWYKAGFYISDDNDPGDKSFECRRDGFRRALTMQEFMARVPLLCTQTDLLPVHNTNYYRIARERPRWWENDGYFHSDSSWYTREVNQLFVDASFL